MRTLLVAALALGTIAAGPVQTVDVELQEIHAAVEAAQEHLLLIAKQERLSELGWYPGRVDAIKGPLTEEAIEGFQEAADTDAEGETLLEDLEADDAPEKPRPVVSVANGNERPSSDTARSGGGADGLSGHRLIIADCESGDRLANGRAVTGSYNWTGINQQGSSASGAFQFIDSTWRWVAHDVLGYTQYPTARSAPPHVQIEAFDWLWANGGKGHWLASAACWSGKL